MSNEENLSMDDFQSELNASFRKMKEGDLITGTILGVTEQGVSVDLGYYTEGFIPAEEVSNDPHFSIRNLVVGDKITGVVIDTESDNGSILLSSCQAADVTAWEKLKELNESKTAVTVKISETVRGGVIAYLEDIRGFIPASQLSLEYVEDLDSFIGKKVDVHVITVDKDHKKLVLSAKEVLRERAELAKEDEISHLQKGLITKGTVDKIMPYGAFVKISKDLSGLLHISQICGKHIASPNEVIKEGEEVTVKILDIKDGKISLSMTAVNDAEKEEIVDDVTDVPVSYSSGEEATTGLGALLKNIKLS